MEKKDEPPGKPPVENHLSQTWNFPLVEVNKNQQYGGVFSERNDISKRGHKLTLKVHSNLEACYYLWNKFSEKKSLFDLWDFRVSWFQGYRYTPYFYTIYQGKLPLAVLPLWYNEGKERYEWFGSDWMEDNLFFTLNPLLVLPLFQILPAKTHLNAIESIDPELFPFLKIEKDDEKYIKNVKRLKTVEEFLAGLKKKRRYNLKRDCFRIGELNPKVNILLEPNFSHFEDIIKLSKRRFNGTLKDETDLIVPERVETYRRILKNSGLYKVRFIKVFIKDRLAAIDLILTYRDRYYALKGANDLSSFSGIGNYMVYLEIKDAIENGLSLIDSLQIDYGWKHRYFDQKKLWKVDKI